MSFKRALATKGIKHKLILPRTPWHNGKDLLCDLPFSLGHIIDKCRAAATDLFKTGFTNNKSFDIIMISKRNLEKGGLDYE